MIDDKNNQPQQDKNPIVPLIEELILSINTSLKTLRLYSLEHPSFLDNVSKLKKKLNDLFDEIENVIEITIQKDKLLFKNEVIGQENEIVKSFGEMLYHLGLQSINFRKGLDNEEIISFLVILLVNPDELMTGEGISAFLKDLKSPFIEIKEREKIEVVRTDELPEGGEAGEAGKLSDEEALKAYFQQQVSSSGEVSQKVFYILVENPQKFSKFLMTLSKKPEGGAQTEIADIASQLNNLSQVMEKMAQDVNQNYPEERAYYLQKLKDLVTCLPGGVRNPLINKTLLSQIETSQTAREIIGQFSTFSLIDIFHSKVVDDNLPLSQLKNILDKIPSLGNDKKAEIIEGVRNKPGLDKEKTESVSVAPTGEAEDIEGIPLADLENKVLELSTYSKEEIRKIESLTTVSSRDDMMYSTTNVLLEVLPVINELNIYLRFVNMLQDFLEVYLSKNRVDIALRILKVFKEEFEQKIDSSLEYTEKLEAAIKEAGSESKIYNLIMIMNDLDKDSRDFQTIGSYLELLGEEAVSVLLIILGKEEKRIIRKLIVWILIDIGQRHIEVLANRLNDERWYLVRNIMSIFGEIRDEKAIDYIRGILNHPDVRVRSEAIRSLGLIGTDKAAVLLFSALKDNDAENKQKAVRWLGEMGSTAAVPQLAKILQKKDFFNRLYAMKEEAIASLEKINTPEAISILQEVVQKKWYQFGGKSRKLRSLAGKSLKKLPTPDKG